MCHQKEREHAHNGKTESVVRNSWFLSDQFSSQYERQASLMQHWEPLGDFFFKYSDFSLKIRAHGQIIEIYLLTFYGNFVQ